MDSNRRRIGPDPIPVPITIPFPVGGVDHSVPVAQQRPLTCRDALNVVNFPSLSNSGGGGKRDGTSKLFEEQLSSDADEDFRITHLRVFIAAQTAAAPSGGGTPTGWSNLGDGLDGAGVWLSLYQNQTKIHVSGDFTHAGGIDATALSERFSTFNIPTQLWDPKPNSAGAFDAQRYAPGRAVVWNAGDGSGTCLYTVGGVSASGPALNQVARWNGLAWTDMGSAIGAGTDKVHCLAVCLGKLYVGGSFAAIGSTGTATSGANSMAVWDPATAIGTWDKVKDKTTLACGVTGSGGIVYCMAAMNNILYVGGDFTTAGGILSCLGTAQFEPNQYPTNAVKGRWGSIGFLNTGPTAAVPYVVQCMTAADIGNGMRLYIGGGFSNWNAGASTTTPGTGMGGTHPSEHSMITSWTGSSFEPLVAGIHGLTQQIGYGVLSMEFYNDGVSPGLWVAGRFSAASTSDGLGMAAPSVAKWDGVRWAAPTKGLAGGEMESVRHMISAGTAPATQLYATGNFATRNNRSVNALALWDGVNWSSLAGAGCPSANSPSFNSAVLDVPSLINDGNTKLYISVYHATPTEYPAIYGCGLAPPIVGSKACRYGLTAYDGTKFGEIPGMTNRSSASQVFALHRASLAAGPLPLGNRLYVTGSMATSGGAPYSRIAAWTGLAWERLGTDLNDEGYALTSDGTYLYVGGKFTLAGAVADTRKIARWDGSVWTPMGTGVSTGNNVNTLLRDGTNIYIGGDFGSLGGTAGFGNIGIWDGAAYVKMLAGFNGTVWAICKFGADFYACGEFTQGVTGAVALGYIAKWNGVAWVAVGGGLTGGTAARCMCVHDDGSGSALYVGGDFHGAVNTGSTPVCYGIARWNGTVWSSVDEAGATLAGFTTTLGKGSVTALAVYQSKLLAAGAILDAGGQSASYFCRGDAL